MGNGPSQITEKDIIRSSDVSTFEDRDQSQKLSGPSNLTTKGRKRKLNDAVYRMYPPEGTKAGAPQVEIIFFHGVTRQDQAKSYITTWMTPDGKVCWPESWLPRHFTDPAIYMVSYDSSALMNSTQGRFDMYNAAESIFINLLLADIGQSSRCPLILVGHDLGGLVIKKVCLMAKEQLQSSGQAKAFLKQLGGVFFLATPHGGLPLKTLPGDRSEIYESMDVLRAETSRLDKEFRFLQQRFSFRTFDIQAFHAPKADQLNWSNEASVRLCANTFLPLSTDSERITRPEDENSGCFPSLRKFIEVVLQDFTVDLKRKLPFSPDSSYVPISETIEKVKGFLLEKNVVVLYGEPGTGKSSLAKYVAYEFQEQSKHDSVFRQGCYFVQCGYGANVVQVQLRLLAELKGSDYACKYKFVRDHELLYKKLRECVDQLDALIILDNVGDYDQVEHLVVRGKKVKYLLTAQESPAWRHDQEIHICKMQDIDFGYGKQILARKVGFPHHTVPDDLKVIVAEILEATGCNPLALATLSTAVSEERKTSPSEWFDIKQHLYTYLARSQQGSTSKSSGREYPRGFYASMMYAVNLLSEEQVLLLSIVSLFQGPSIHFRVIRHFARLIRPGWEELVYMLLKGLIDRNILQRREEGSEVRDFSVSIHPLRQHFVLRSPEEPLMSTLQKIKSCLRNGAPYDSPYRFHKLVHIRLAHALCALYGVEDTRKFVEDLVGDRFLPSMTQEAVRDCLLPFLKFLDGPRSRDGTHEMAQQIFEELVIKGELHTYSVLKLFEKGECASFISRTLVDLFPAIAPEESRGLYLPAFEYSFYSILNLFIVHKRSEESIHMLRAFIGGITCSSKFLAKTSVPTFLDDCEDAFGLLEDSMWAAVLSFAEDVGCVAGNLVVANTNSDPCIRLIPGAVEIMVGKFCSVRSDRKEVQFQSLAMFAFMAIANAHPYSFLSVVPGAVDALLHAICETASVSCEYSNRLNILSKFLALLVLKDAFENGLVHSACLKQFNLSEYSRVLEALVKVAEDSSRQTPSSFASAIITHLLLVHVWKNRSLEVSRECLDLFHKFSLRWHNSSPTGKALAQMLLWRETYASTSATAAWSRTIDILARGSDYERHREMYKQLYRCITGISLCSFLSRCVDSLITCMLIASEFVGRYESIPDSQRKCLREDMRKMWSIVTRVARLLPSPSKTDVAAAESGSREQVLWKLRLFGSLVSYHADSLMTSAIGNPIDFEFRLHPRLISRTPPSWDEATENGQASLKRRLELQTGTGSVDWDSPWNVVSECLTRVRGYKRVLPWEELNYECDSVHWELCAVSDFLVSSPELTHFFDGDSLFDSLS